MDTGGPNDSHRAARWWIWARAVLGLGEGGALAMEQEAVDGGDPEIEQEPSDNDADLARNHPMCCSAAGNHHPSGPRHHCRRFSRPRPTTAPPIPPADGVEDAQSAQSTGSVRRRPLTAAAFSQPLVVRTIEKHRRKNEFTEGG